MVTHWLAELDGRRVTVEVPASSANLGAGYDCLGLALDLVDRIDARGPRLEPRRDRADGRGRGRRRAGRATRRTASSWASRPPSRARGELPDERRLADRRCATRSRWPRPRLVGRRDRRRPARRQRPARRPARPPADLLALATDDRGPPRQRGGRPAGRLRRGRRARTSPPTGDPLRRPARPAGGPVHPRPAPLDGARCAPSCRPAGPARGRDRQPRPGRDRRRRARDRDATTARGSDPGPAPRAVPGGGLSRSCPALVEAARDAGALGACLSGAGSTVIAFADSVATFSRIKAAFAAVAADRDLPGRGAIVMPRNAGARVVGPRV